MPRILTARMAEALVSGFPRVVLAKIEHPSGDFYGWSGIGTLAYAGREWTGFGALGRVTPVKSVSELAIQDITFELDGVNADVIERLSQSVKGKSGTLWLACLEQDGSVVRDPYELLEADLDVQDFDASEDLTCKVKILAHSGFYTLERPLNEVWSSENQRQNYPSDTGLDLLHTLENQDIGWTKT